MRQLEIIFYNNEVISESETNKFLLYSAIMLSPYWNLSNLKENLSHVRYLFNSVFHSNDELDERILNTIKSIKDFKEIYNDFNNIQEIAVKLLKFPKTDWPITLQIASIIIAKEPFYISEEHYRQEYKEEEEEEEKLISLSINQDFDF